MPRRGGGGSRPKPTATKAKSTQTKQPVASKPSPAPAQQTPKTQPNQTTHQQPGTHGTPQQPIIQQRGPGLLGTLGASMAGSMIGHVVANKFFGGNEKEVAEAEALAADPHGEEKDPCVPHFRSFMSCVDQNGATDVNKCQWVYDLWKECKAKPNAFMQ
eukprot:TRINITY_DN3079_c0_g1_i1.p1 TRINITY_DN3079_c0_g1~~TRINITY_DN3079_c0_g1_i1.p1  ORF type:complete len:159 (+),score=50.94 TRINITY_DN3079_c0_g1_i1:57-533(+)